MSQGLLLPRTTAVTASVVALVALLAATLLGIEISHGDQVVNLGLFQVGATGVVLLALAGAVVAAGAAALIRPRLRWFAAAVAALLGLLTLATRARILRDADAINEGTGAVGSALSRAVDGPISSVDAGTNATLLMITATAGAASAIVHCLARRKGAPRSNSA